MRLSDQTWTEVKEYLKRQSTLILPVGTCEQHAKHLPLDTDTVLAEYMADYVSEQTGILVAPTIAYGVNLPCDRHFEGTCSTTEDILRGLVFSICQWWKLQGFQRFLVFTAHGDRMHLKALRESDPTVRVLLLYSVDLQDVLEKQKFTQHACESETSVMLHLYRKKVRKTQCVDFETPRDLFLGYLDHQKTDPIVGSPGCQGYPTAATAKKGRRILDLMKKYSLAWVRAELSIPPPSSEKSPA